MHSVEGLTFNKLISTGTFAEVWLATDVNGMQFAVKCLEKRSQSLAHLWFEHALLDKLKHERIVSLVKTIDTKHYLYIIQEYCQCDLFEFLTNNVVDPPTAIRIFIQLCEAVNHCHSNEVFHRDLKPENVLLKDGQVKLADFGLSTTDFISDGVRTGSDRYMSPEVFGSNMLHLNSANDVWALGIILINLLASSNPWSEASKTNLWFIAFLSHPKLYLQRQFKFSDQLCKLLTKVFSIDPLLRPTVYELSKSITKIGVNNMFMDQDNTQLQSPPVSPTYEMPLEVIG
jgi:serine/threonine protein kinase